jgi:hypothetical protein
VSVRYVTVVSFDEKIWKATGWRYHLGTANLAFQETCPGYQAIERHVLSVGPKLSHSCFVQYLLHDEGFSELKIVEKKASFLSRIIYAPARPRMSAFRVTALYSPLQLGVTLRTTGFNAQKFYVLPEECIYLFRVNLRTNRHHVHICH